MIFEGKAHIFGDSISADHIISTQCINKVPTLREMLPYLLEEQRKDFYKEITPGDILVAGENFGGGSSREHAPMLIKESGLSCIIARSFGRNFFRNAINLGIPLVEVNWQNLHEGQQLKVYFSEGYLQTGDTSEIFKFSHLPPIMEKILLAGGLIPYFKTAKSLQIT